MQNLRPLARIYSWAGWFESYLVANSEDRCSRDKAHIISESHVLINTLQVRDLSTVSQDGLQFDGDGIYSLLQTSHGLAGD